MPGLRKTWCGLFTAGATISATTWAVSHYLGSLAKQGTQSFINDFLNSPMILRNITTTVSVPFLPNPVDFTMEKMAFTMQEAITGQLAETLAALPDKSSDLTQNILITTGAIVFALTSGILIAARLSSHKNRNEHEEALINVTVERPVHSSGHTARR